MSIPAASILLQALLVCLVIQGGKSLFPHSSWRNGVVGKIAVNVALNFIAAFGSYGGLTYIGANWGVIAWMTVLGSAATAGLHWTWTEARTRRAG